MIIHSDIRNPIVAGLNDFMDIPVIQAEDVGEQPSYPFMTFSLNSPWLELGHNSKEEIIQAETVTERETEHFEQVYSFTIVAKDEDVANNLLYKAIQYFRTSGVQYLKDNNIAIVKVLNAQKRDNFLTIDYERRVGFDVRIRVAHSIDQDTDYFDTINFN